MQRSTLTNAVGPVLAAALALGGASRHAIGADINVDLDGTTSNRESNVKLSVLQNYPAKVRNKVTNKAVGQAFRFAWHSAGPGGFSSNVAAGTSTGTGTIWDWETTRTIFSFTGSTCNNDICFTRTIPATPPVTRGPFGAPGRSLTSSGVTTTNESLTVSIISFASPETELFRAQSSVEQLASGGFRYTTRLENLTTDTLVVDVAPGPLGCVECEEGETSCGGECTDTDTDPENCGECGVECGEGEKCSDGECGPSCDEGETDCGGECVDTDTDEDHCGECETECDDPKCPYDDYCYEGECFCGEGSGATGGPPTEACVYEGGEGIEVPPGGAFETCSTDSHPAKEISSQITVCGPPIPEGDPECSGGGQASQGIFNVFVPDTSVTIGDVYIVPYDVIVDDSAGSGDGLVQPGEKVDLRIVLLNAGTMTLGGVTGTLSSPPIDLTEDGTFNEIAVMIAPSVSPYPDLLGSDHDGTDGCGGAAKGIHPAANVIPFGLTVPPDHPADVARPFLLEVSGTPSALHSSDPAPSGPRSGGALDTVVSPGESAGESAHSGGLPVPIVLGIASACDPVTAVDDFDGVEGLLPPMARLVLAGNAPPFPHQTSRLGRTIPLKLHLKCGGVKQGANDLVPPEIVGLTRLGSPDVEIDLGTVEIGDQPNRNTLFFRQSGGSSPWIYNLRTRDLTAGRYHLRIQMANGSIYLAGFELR